MLPRYLTHPHSWPWCGDVNNARYHGDGNHHKEKRGGEGYEGGEGEKVYKKKETETGGMPAGPIRNPCMAMKRVSRI